MRRWQRIRRVRPDLTDYVIHFTKFRLRRDGEDKFPGRPSYSPALDVFKELLNDGEICPTFAPIKSRTTGTTANTVRGPNPAVCLTEQPLSAVLATRQITGSRYSGYGIAYHKYALYQAGGRPVFYGPESMMGTRLYIGELGFEPGKDIYIGGLPLELQYLWVRYKPTIATFNDDPVDFTWEREWRFCCRDRALPLFLEEYASPFTEHEPAGALVVEFDSDVAEIQEVISQKAVQGCSWATRFNKIVSLETAKRMLDAGDWRYARIETWPN